MHAYKHRLRDEKLTVMVCLIVIPSLKPLIKMVLHTKART